MRLGKYIFFYYMTVILSESCTPYKMYLKERETSHSEKDETNKSEKKHPRVLAE